MGSKWCQYFATLLLLQSARASGGGAHEHNGDHDHNFTWYLSDSGASLSNSYSSAATKDLSLEPALQRIATMGPWQAQLALQRGYDRINLPLLRCRQRVHADLMSADGLERERASSCVQEARDALDAAVSRYEAALPDPDPAHQHAHELEPTLREELAALQDTLRRRERFPGSAVIEKRVQRLRGLARDGVEPGPMLVAIRDSVRELRLQLWPKLRRCLDRAADAAPAHSRGGRAVWQLRNCIQHRLELEPEEDPHLLHHELHHNYNNNDNHNHHKKHENNNNNNRDEP